MEHYWRDLPGPIWFSGADIYARFVAGVTGPAVAVELGAWKGRSTSCMGVEIARSDKPITFHAVDHWRGSEGEEAHAADDDVAGGTLFDVFTRNIAPVAAHVHPIRDDTVRAAARFADGSIDFLYVDAAHTYEGVLRDLAAWFPKVRVGGLIAGDDWLFTTRNVYGVRLAVQDFFGAAADQVAVESGSAPNQDWLQWSLIKTADLRPAPAPVIALKRRWRTAAAVGMRIAARLRRLAVG